MKLEIKNLSKSYGKHVVIDSIDLLLPACQTLTIIGPSGSGKSTLLRILAGLEYPDKGTIIFDEKEVIFKEDLLREYRRSIGVVFQSWNLFPHLTALENIVLPLYRVHNLSLEESQERSMALLKRFDLDEHAFKKPYALSGGQIQRIALIRAVAGQPKMLLLDEPTSALDPLMTSEVFDLILELKKEHRDLILVTHHLSFAKKISDWILFIADGKILEQGTVHDVFDNPSSPLVKEYMSKVLAYC